MSLKIFVLALVFMTSTLSGAQTTQFNKLKELSISAQAISDNPLTAGLLNEILGDADLKVITGLIAQGADASASLVNDYGGHVYPLQLAVRKGLLEVVEYLLAQGASAPGLLDAALYAHTGSIELAKLLISKGAAPVLRDLQEAISLRTEAIRQGKGDVSLRMLDMIKILIKEMSENLEDDSRMIEYSIRFGDLETLNLIAKAGADISDGLFNACYYGRPWALQYLLENYSLPIEKASNPFDQSPLLTCLDMNHGNELLTRLEGGVYLLQHGANPNARDSDNFETPAMKAVQYWFTDFFMVNAKAKQSAAALKGFLTALKTAGADFGLKNADDMTALDIAVDEAPGKWDAKDHIALKGLHQEIIQHLKKLRD